MKLIVASAILYFACAWRACEGQSDEELVAAAEAIWDADQYRFPDGDAVIDPEGPKLFTYVNEGRIGGTPIYQYLRNLFPYYDPVLGSPDPPCDAACQTAQDRFLDEMYNRPGRPMQVAQDFLVSFGLAPSDVEEFKELLRQYWFTPYSRGGSGLLDSSGFEHTFLGERAGGQVVGFYNWVVTYYEEKAGRFVYGASSDQCYPLNLELEFEWSGASKTGSAMFIRTTPEVEMALYTLCFLARPNQDCELTFDGVPNVLRVDSMSDVSPLTVGEAYPLCNGSLSSGGPPGQEDLDAVSERIWAADRYRFPADQAQVNDQGPILFGYVNESLFTQPPFAAFLPLLDNYDPYTGVPEVCGQPCRDEEDAFLDEILSQPDSPMRIAHDFLADYGLASPDLAAFKLELREWWFQLYSRSGGPLDSSGFEHVFLGEIRSGSNVLGLHNWVYVYLEEKAGEFVYGSKSNECQPYQLVFSHTWLDRPKPINSLWVRASPDVELALFTVCFQVRQTSSCEIMLEGIRNRVTTFDYSGHVPRTVGTAYPTC